MGKGASTKETVNNVQKVELPAWMSAAGEGLYRDASNAAAANPVTGYTRPMVAGMNDNLTGAGAMAAKKAQAGHPDLGIARALTARGVGEAPATLNAGKFDADAAREYSNPYLEQVQQRTLQEMGRQGKMEMQGIGDSAGAASAYGGTRHALLESEAQKNQNNNMLDYLAKSNADAFDNAGALWNQDRAARLSAEGQNIDNLDRYYGRMGQAGAQFASLAGQEAQLQSNNLMDLLRTGGVQQDAENAALGADYQEFLRMQDAPMQRYQQLASVLSGVPHNSTSTTNGTNTTKQSGGWLNTLLGAGQIAASAFSDRRLKRDIELQAVRADGLGVYSFRYVWDRARRHIGVMADEVARMVPVALGPRVGGFATVDYSKLGEVA